VLYVLLTGYMPQTSMYTPVSAGPFTPTQQQAAGYAGPAASSYIGTSTPSANLTSGSRSLSVVMCRLVTQLWLTLNCSGSLFIAKTDTLEGRREEWIFRRNVLGETSCLYYLLKSQERSQEIINWLCSSQTYEHCSMKTEKFRKSFIPFSVNGTSNIFI